MQPFASVAHLLGLVFITRLSLRPPRRRRNLNLRVSIVDFSQRVIGKKDPLCCYFDCEQMQSCCGILELFEISYGFFDSWADPEEGKVSLVDAHTKLIEAMHEQFGDYPMVVWTDCVKGDAHKLMDIFDHPGWTKTIVFSEHRNPNSGNKLVMCTLVRKK